MRADRLLSILYALQEGRHWTSANLAERLEVSIRTIARDVDALTQAGVPIYAARGRHGGIRLLQATTPPTVGLNAEQLSLLLSAGAPLTDLGLGSQHLLATQKVLSAASSQHRQVAAALQQRLLIDHHRWTPVQEDTSSLTILFEAVRHDMKVSFNFPSRRKGLQGRLVEPYALVLKGTVWYLVAREEGDAVKTWRVSRVQDILLTSETFVRDRAFDLPAYWSQWVNKFEDRPAPPVRVTVSVDWDALDALLKLAQSQQIELGDAGRAVVTVTYADEEIALSRMLLLAGQVRLLGPPAMLNRLSQLQRRLNHTYHQEFSS